MKNKIIALLASLVLLSSLAGCDSSTSSSKESEKSPEVTHSVSFNKDDLAYDKKTKIIYIRNEIDVYRSTSDSYVYTPYISENGYYCKLVDGKIVEINNENEKAESEKK